MSHGRQKQGDGRRVPTSRFKRFVTRVSLGAAIFAVGTTVTQAHDFWLEPGSPFAAKGDELVLHLNMGERLATEEERGLLKDRIARFDFFGARTGRRDLLASGVEAQLPVARVRLESGSALVVMDRKLQTIVIPAPKFNEYLTAEGLETILAQRARSGQTDTAGKEGYLRFLKVLIQERDPTAANANTLYKRRVGERLEILLENDPGQLPPDGKLTVKILFEGKPLAGAKVFACRRAGTDPKQAPLAIPAVTSAKGLADFKLDEPGLWLVRLVHMRANAGAAKTDPAAPQWESFWASYAFAARTSPTPTLPTLVPTPVTAPSVPAK